jgi:outer membrane protein TolC
VLRAVEDVESAATLLVRRERQLGELTTGIGATTQALSAVRQAHAAGVVPLTDVLDVERRLLSLQDEQAQAIGEAGRSAVSTYRALGGGWL